MIGLAPAASAAYGNEPVGPAWTPNGGVHAVVTDGARVYIGGTFTGGVAALDATSGALVWLGNANGDVRALALGPGGSLLLGGAFTTVDGTTHRKIASVSAATGAVNDTFRGAAGGTVRDIVVVGANAYFGGAFTNHGGMAQQGLGAVNATTGANVTTFTATTNGTVYSLATDNSRLFIGGNFTTVNGLARDTLASVTLSSHALDAWAPRRACTGCNVIWDMTLSGNKVFTAGRNAGGLYALDKATGAPVHRLGGFNGDTQAVTVAPDGRLYLGGHFVTVGGVDRELVAEFDVSTTTPRLLGFSANFVTVWPGVWAMASTSSRLYVGGDFTVAGTQTKKYPYFAMFPSTSAPPPDTTAPTATVSPASGATNVAPTTNVTATFNEAVQGVSGTTFTLRAAGAGSNVPATVAYNATTRVATLDPGADLAPSTQYTATLTGGATAIRDMANNAFATTSWTFTTAAATGGDTTPPTATVSPASGATDVAPTTTVTATFNEAVQGVSGTTFTLRAAGAGSNVPATVAYNATTRVATLDPGADLAPSTQYTATLTGGATAIRDMANNAFATTSWTFTTAAATGGDTTPPTWTGRIPSKDGATGISRTTNVTVAFSEEVVNVTTATFTLRLATGGSNIAGTVSFNTTSGRWVLNPSSTLAANTQYTATMSNAVTDVAGNPFAGMSWSFTTGA